MEVRWQLVTVTFRVARRLPRAKLVFRQMASSRDSMRQLLIRTFSQQSGSMPSEYPFWMVTPRMSTSPQPRRLML